MGNENGDERQISYSELYNLILNISNQNKDIKEQNEEIRRQNEQIKINLNTIKQDISSDLNNLRQKINALEGENQVLINKLQTIDRKSRKFNLVIYGLKGEEQNTYESVLDLLRNNLGIQCACNDLRDVYRFGKNNDKARPVLVEFLTYKLKSEILNNSKKLKGTNVYVSPEYTPEDWEKRKFLNRHLKLAREKKYSAKIRNNKLYINGDSYTYDDLKSKIELKENLEKEEEQKSDEIGPLSPEQRKVNSTPNTPSTIPEQSFLFSQTTESNKRKPENSPEISTGAKPKKTIKQQQSQQNRASSRNRQQRN